MLKSSKPQQWVLQADEYLSFNANRCVLLNEEADKRTGKKHCIFYRLMELAMETHRLYYRRQHEDSTISDNLSGPLWQVIGTFIHWGDTRSIVFINGIVDCVDDEEAQENESFIEHTEWLTKARVDYDVNC